MRYRTAMRRCLELARRAEGRTEPNPMVGAVILRDADVVAEGWHEGPGRAHAEVDALRRLETSAEGLTLVVNLEPCCHVGRTPPCSDALIRAGVARVVVGMVDPNPLVSGKGIRQLREAGIEVVLGVEESRCLELNRDFVDRIRRSVDSGELDRDGFVPGGYRATAKAAPTRFVVLSAPRTGSNYLCSLLDSHPEVLCHHELFNLDGVRCARSCSETGFDLGTPYERDLDPVGFLHRAWGEHDGARALGFKLARRHPEFVFRDVIADRGVKKILLRRRNRLKTYVSDLIAWEEQRWTHYGQHPDRLERISVEVDVDGLRAFADEYEAFYDRMRRSLRERDEPWLEVDYETLFLPGVLAEILTFLGLSASELEGLRGATPKRNADDLRAIVSNYDELVLALKGTPFEGELQELTRWRAARPQALRLDLYVSDLVESRDFYTRALGMDVVRNTAEQAVLHSQAVSLCLHQHGGAGGERSVRHNGFEIVLEVDCLDFSFAKIASAGWPIQAAPQRRPGGGRDFRVHDPDGYPILLTQRVPASATANS